MEQIELTFESGEDSLSPRYWTVNDEISTPFVATVIAVSPKTDVDLDAITGKGAGIRFAGSRAELCWTGVCARAVSDMPESTGLSTYTFVIVPDLWLLGQRRAHRIFQHQTAPEIVQAILKEWKIEPELRLTGPFSKKEYRVQHGETDLEFVSRLLEEDGIAYYFQPKIEGGKGESKLVLCDAPHRAPARKGALPWVSSVDRSITADFVTDVHFSRRTRPGKATMRDYDLRRRDFGLLGKSEQAEAIEAALEQYAYLPGGFLIDEAGAGGGDTPVADDKSKARHDDKEGKARAQRHHEAERARTKIAHFRTDVFDLLPGVVFTMDHPSPELGPDKKLLVRAYEMNGERAGGWTITCQALPASMPFRPDIKTKKPRVYGLTAATVVGPAGQEIYTDEFGRVRLRFPWDREGEFDDKRTPWVRVSNAWAGAGFGGQMIPRVGQEVLVSYFDGDPDQPVIVGRVHTQTQPVPYTLPANKTISAWKSVSSPGGGGFNEIKIEDKKGQELVYIQAEKDLVKLVKNDESETTGHDRGIVVQRNRTAIVEETDKTTVGQKHLVNVIAANDLEVLRQEAPDVTPKETRVEMIDRKITITTGESTIVLEGPNITVTANQHVIIDGKEVVIKGGPEVYINCDPPDRLALARALVDVVGSADQNDGELVAQELAKLPRHVLQQLLRQGTRVKVCRGSVTDYRTDLAGVHPRGWPPGATWDSVPGLQSNGEVVIATVGHGTPAGAHVPQTGEGHGSYNMVIHETFHAVDLGGGPSRSANDAAFNAARNADLSTLSAYEQQPGNAGREESYAETAARYYGGDPNFATQSPNLNGYWSTNPILGAPR